MEKYNSINKVTSPAVSLYSIKGGEKLEMIRFLDCYRLMMSAKGTIEGNVFFVTADKSNGLFLLLRAACQMLGS